MIAIAILPYKFAKKKKVIVTPESRIFIVSVQAEFFRHCIVVTILPYKKRVRNETQCEGQE